MEVRRPPLPPSVAAAAHGSVALESHHTRSHGASHSPPPPLPHPSRPRLLRSVGDTVAKITDTQGGWEYSQAALDLVALYHRTFPRVFQVLNAIPNPPKGEYSRNHFGGEDAVDAIKSWLNQVRCPSVAVPCARACTSGGRRALAWPAAIAWLTRCA